MLSISQLLKKSGHQIFINILPVLFVSIGWSIILVPSIFILPIPWSFGFLALTIVPATTAVFATLHQVVQGERKYVRLFIKSFFKFFPRSFLFGLFVALAFLIPISEWWYYLNVNHSYWMFLFAVFQTYLCLTFLAMQVYTIPLMVMENMPTFTAMNRSFKYFLAHVWHTIGLFLQIACATILLSLSVMGFFFLYIGMLAIFVLNATQNLQQVTQLPVKEEMKVSS